MTFIIHFETFCSGIRGEQQESSEASRAAGTCGLVTSVEIQFDISFGKTALWDCF